MNPFIEELALKCTPAYQQPNFDYEKFAELLIQESARIAEEVDGDSRARECVLKHFGIE
jgi:hypothetical protein